MNEPENKFVFGTRLALIILIGLFLLPAGAWAISIGLEPISLRPGESGTTNLSLSGIPSGLSGYRTGMKLTTPGIAEITDVRFPPWAGLKDQTGFPGPDVNIMAAGFETVPKNTEMTVLATLTVKGIATGTSGLMLYSLSIDDENGDPINASVEIASITVSSGTAPGGSTSSDSGNAPGGASSAATDQVTTQPSGMTTTIQPQVQILEQTNAQELQSQITAAATDASTAPSGQPAAATTTARRVPFLTFAGMLGALALMLIFGKFGKNR
jgi:hypothetical protein